MADVKAEAEDVYYVGARDWSDTVEMEAAARRNLHTILGHWMELRTNKTSRLRDSGIVLVYILKSVDDPWPECRAVTGKEDAQLNKAVEFAARNMWRVGVAAFPEGPGQAALIFIDVDKLIPALSGENPKVYRHDFFLQVVKHMKQQDLFVRWQEACVEPSLQMVEFATGSRKRPRRALTVAHFRPEHIDRIISLARKEEFYLDQIRGLCQERKTPGLCLLENNALVAFTFYSVAKWQRPMRDVSGRSFKTACLKIDYLLVSSEHRRQNIGSQILTILLAIANDEFPGHQIVAEVESKPREPAMRFWFSRQRFHREAAQPGRPVPGSRSYAAHPLLEALDLVDDMPAVKDDGVDPFAYMMGESLPAVEVVRGDGNSCSFRALTPWRAVELPAAATAEAANAKEKKKQRKEMKTDAPDPSIVSRTPPPLRGKPCGRPSCTEVIPAEGRCGRCQVVGYCSVSCQVRVSALQR